MTRSRLLIVALIVVAAASFLRAASFERERFQLVKTAEEATKHMEQAQAERTHLNTELAGARQTLDNQTGDLQHLQGSLRDTQDQLDKTLNELASLKKQHEGTRQANASLTKKMGRLEVEKQQLEAKLSSIKALKLAIRDLKVKERHERWLAWRKRIEDQKKIDQKQLAKGNRGLVIKNGASTLGTATRMHVHVLDPEAK